MTYELFMKGPAVYIPVLIFSLIITLVAYGAAPLIVAKVRTKKITKKKYKWMCHGINAIVAVGFLLLNGDVTSFAPYLLWTGVFSAWGAKILENRGVMEGYDYIEHPDSRLNEDQDEEFDGWRCSCGRKNAKYVSTCYCGLCKSEQAHNENASSAIGDAATPVRFCRKCGQSLMPNGNFCRKCGTKVMGGSEYDM